MNYDDFPDNATFDAQPKAPAETTSSELRSNIASVETALTEFERVSSGLSELRERFPVDLVYNVSTAQGMLEAVAHRAAYRDPRLAVERIRKQAKAPIIALGKNVDARAAWVTAQLLLGEKPVDAIIKAEEARKEAIKQARIDAEAGRIIAIQEALEEISMDAMLASGKTSGFIASMIADRQAWEPDADAFQEMIANAHQAKASVLAKLELAHKAALHTEAEAAKLAAERAELEALRKAAAEQRAKEEEAHRIERERASAEIAAQRAELLRQSEELAAQAKAQAITQALLDQAAPPVDQPAPPPAAASNTAPPEIADDRPAPAADEPATLKLGAVCDRLGLTVTSAFIADTLGIPPAATDKRAVLYRESQFADICDALIDHISDAKRMASI